MRLILTTEQQELAGAVRSFLAAAAPTARVREVAEGEESYDRKTWERLAGELGVTGLAIPEEYGGAGAGRAEVAVVLEELGAALTPVPYFASSVLAAEALLALDDEAAKREYLPGIAAGTTVATLAFAEGVTASADHTLEGRAERVLHGADADLLLVVASLDGKPAVFAVRGEAVQRTPLEVLDLTRPQATVEFSATPARLVGPADASQALARTLDVAGAVLASEQLGGLRRCLDTIVEYTKLRVQFGRFVGSFQGVKHRLADLHCLLEQAESVARHAAWAADEAPEELPVAAALAQAYTGPAYFRVAKEHLLLHGGIGFTWEHDAHFSYKRAKSSELLLGPRRRHRALLAERLGLG
ncbi:acyl-CoA dehydrogenase family protein [Actinocorallia libanotica]|uniref:Acyl-CoA dehydrogenase family protein n=1 Tax=Actinocorallia libanotica TaxID=46162 RepID=A0ABN1S2N7_9ACTN